MARVLAVVLGYVLISSMDSAAQIQVFTTQPPVTAPGMPVPQGAPGTPARDNRQTPGSAVIRGRVFGADTGQPLRKLWFAPTHRICVKDVSQQRMNRAAMR